MSIMCAGPRSPLWFFRQMYRWCSTICFLWVHLFHVLRISDAARRIVNQPEMIIYLSIFILISKEILSR